MNDSTPDLTIERMEEDTDSILPEQDGGSQTIPMMDGMFDQLVATDAFKSEHDMEQLRRGREMTEPMLAEIIGRRLVIARELNALSQSEGATLLGYKTSAQLCLWEKGERLPPATGLIAAACAYAVSIDFLLGTSDEPDRDPRAVEKHAIMRGIRRMLDDSAERAANLLQEHVRQSQPAIVPTRDFIDAAVALCDAATTCRELNPEFDDLRAGAPVLHALEALRTCAAQALAQVERGERIAAHIVGVAAIRRQSAGRPSLPSHSLQHPDGMPSATELPAPVGDIEMSR